jgi:hypothetical protein
VLFRSGFEEKGAVDLVRKSGGLLIGRGGSVEQNSFKSYSASSSSLYNPLNRFILF